MHTTILSLQSQLEQAKERLKDVEDDIKKSTGRDLSNPRAFKRQLRTDEEPLAKRRATDIKGRLGDWVDRPRGQARPLYQRNANDRVRDGVMERIPAKKRLGEVEGGNYQAVTVFSRLSGPPKAVDEEEKEKVKITSQVLVQETPSRREILAAQNVDTSCKERNRRMFGALMGTLQKFRQEENKLKEKEEKRAEVERRVEEAAEREREAAKRQRLELFSTRRQQQSHIRHIEFKIIRLKQLAEWEENKRRLLPFIATSTSPKIFYLPKKHNDKTSALLKSNQDIVNKEIEKKRSEVEKLIEDSATRAKEAEEEQNITLEASERSGFIENDDDNMDEDDMEDHQNSSFTISTVGERSSSAPKRRVTIIRHRDEEDDDENDDNKEEDAEKGKKKRQRRSSKRKSKREQSSDESSSSSSDSDSSSNSESDREREVKSEPVSPVIVKMEEEDKIKLEKIGITEDSTKLAESDAGRKGDDSYSVRGSSPPSQVENKGKNDDGLQIESKH